MQLLKQISRPAYKQVGLFENNRYNLVKLHRILLSLDIKECCNPNVTQRCWLSFIHEDSQNIHTSQYLQTWQECLNKEGCRVKHTRFSENTTNPTPASSIPSSLFTYLTFFFLFKTCFYFLIVEDFKLTIFLYFLFTKISIFHRKDKIGLGVVLLSLK